MVSNNESSVRLSEQSCEPCQGGVPPLSPEKIQKFLAYLEKEWFLTEKGYLSREYRFSNFVEAMEFASKITRVAEAEGHHPDLGVGWGYCHVTLSTHTINGLTESDFILAKKIEDLS